MNFRIFLGLWANAQTRSVQRARYKAAPAPAVAANFMKCRLLCMGNSSLRFSMRRTSHLSWLFSTERARPRAGQMGRATRTGYDGPGVRPAFTRKFEELTMTTVTVLSDLNYLAAPPESRIEARLSFKRVGHSVMAHSIGSCCILMEMLPLARRGELCPIHGPLRSRST